jgi:hypothetical protein
MVNKLPIFLSSTEFALDKWSQKPLQNNRNRLRMVGEVGLEPTKASASGFTVRPLCRSGHSPACAVVKHPQSVRQMVSPPSICSSGTVLHAAPKVPFPISFAIYNRICRRVDLVFQASAQGVAPRAGLWFLYRRHRSMGAGTKWRVESVPRSGPPPRSSHPTVHSAW